MMEENMIGVVRERAGMGTNPDHFYTNMSESMNCMLKRCTGFKAHDLRPFIEKVFELVGDQENLLKKAVIRNDRWRFREEYKHLEVDLNKWFHWSEDVQKRHMKKVYQSELGSCELSRNISVHVDEATKLSYSLSVDYKELLNSSVITMSTLQDMWQKATHLAFTPGLVTVVPGQPNSNNRIVASMTNGPPHYVTKKSEGQFVCTGVCPRFTANKICQHTVAAAENCKQLSQFCAWWKMHHTGPNIDSLAVVGLPKGVAGQKGGKSKRGRNRAKSSGAQASNVSDHVKSVAVSPNANSPSQLLQPYSPYNYAGNHTYYGTSWPTCHDPQANTPVRSNPNVMPVPFSPAGTKQFFLKMLTKSIKICAGCRLGYDNSTSMPSPPYNICIAHEESRVISPATGKSFSTATTVHYHANPQCIWLRYPSFVCQELQVPSDVSTKLQEEHKIYLYHYFGIAI